MKKTVKIIALILLVLSVTALSVLGAGVAEPSLEIEATNLSFVDSISILYAVSSRNVDPEGVKLLVWSAPMSSVEEYVKGTEDYVIDSHREETVGGRICRIFDYDKLGAHQMTDAVYARAYVEVGNKSYYSDLSKYSVARYAGNKLGNTGTESENDLLKNTLRSMLSYGAAMQIYADYKVDRLPTASFYKLSVKGGYLPDGSRSGLYLAGDSELIVAPEYDSAGRRFYAWLDGDGEVISQNASTRVTVGTENLTYVASYDPDDESALAYSVNADGRTCTVTGIGGCGEAILEIPEFMGKYMVTAIGDDAFSECERLTYVEIPSTVEKIGDRAFYGCTGLTEITIPESVVDIGTQIFYKAYNLSTVYYNSPYSSTVNPFLAREHITRIVFGGNAVPAYICSKNDTVKEVEILDGVKHVYVGAFSECSGIESITIPRSVESVAEYAFAECPSLRSVTVGKRVGLICESTFYNCDSLESVSLPDGIVSIGELAFADCDALCGIDLPRGLTDVARSAFYNCDALLEIEFPRSLVSVGESAFCDCDALRGITLPSSLTDVGKYAFSECDSLTSVTLHTETVCGEWFSDCRALSTVSFGEEVKSISSHAFIGCTAIAELYLPPTVESIGLAAFYGCDGLEKITVPFIGSDEKGSASKHFGHIFGGTSYTDNGEFVPESLKTVVITGGKSIYDNAFDGCRNIKRVIIPSSVEHIGNYAFWNCEALESIELPLGIKSIGACTFFNCRSLASIVIPDSITKIEYYAFGACASLKSIVMPDSVSVIEDYAFAECAALCDVYYTAGEREWSRASIGIGNETLTDATKHWFYIP